MHKPFRNTGSSFSEKELFEKFAKGARYLGGGCYSINFFNKEIFDTDTLSLRKKYQACFVERAGRYFYK